jgi:hypothetical protein
MVFKRYSDCGLPLDRHLVWTVLPIIPEDLIPPHGMSSNLNMIRPPPLDTVMRHVCNITGEGGGGASRAGGGGGEGGGGGGKGRSGTATAFAYESPVLSSYTDTATEVFSSIFKYLDDMFNALPPATVEKLRRMPCIPVGAGGSRLVQPCHM